MATEARLRTPVEMVGESFVAEHARRALRQSVVFIALSELGWRVEKGKKNFVVESTRLVRMAHHLTSGWPAFGRLRA